MDENGISEPTAQNTLGTAFTVAGIAASIVAFTATGGLAILAGIVAAACLAGSVATSLAPNETPFERYCEECDQATAFGAVELATGQGQEAGHSHRWRHAVASSREAGRSR